MSVIAYYAHVTAEQMQHVREAPQQLWHIRENPKLAGAELFDMDKDYQVISWLLSEKKRDEAKGEAAQMAAMMRKDIARNDKEAFKKALAEERAKLGVTVDLATLYEMPDDPIVTAIEGRGTEDQRDEAITFGMGGARVFPPAEVKALSEQIQKIQPSDLHRHFNRKEMAVWDVGGIGWLEEDDDVLDKALMPAFKRFQEFYKRAAEANQYVLVIYQ